MDIFNTRQTWQILLNFKNGKELRYAFVTIMMEVAYLLRFNESSNSPETRTTQPNRCFIVSVV